MGKKRKQDESQEPVAVAPAEPEEKEVELFPDTPPEVTNAVVGLDEVWPQIENHPAEPTAGFVESVKKLGILTPVWLVRRPDPKNHSGWAYEVKAGIRRIKAAKRAGLSTIPARVVSIPSHVADALTLVENWSRSANAVSELKAIERLLLVQASPKLVAKQLGVPFPLVQRRLRLAKLIPTLREAWENGQFGVSVAEGLAALPESLQLAAVEIATAKKFKLTLADVREVRMVRTAAALQQLPGELFEGPTAKDASPDTPQQRREDLKSLRVLVQQSDAKTRGRIGDLIVQVYGDALRNETEFEETGKRRWTSAAEYGNALMSELQHEEATS